jgi:HSP20 family protein
MTLVKFKTAPVKFSTPAFGPLTRPAVNVTASAEGFEIELAAPGLQREDFSIRVENDVLTISTNKQTENKESDTTNYRRREFSYERFERAFHLPESIDTEGIKAAYQNGILRITLSFKPEVKPAVRTITVA